MKDFMEFLKGHLEGESRTINAHYGVKEGKYEQWVKEILSDLVLSEDKSNVIDKHFPKLSSEDRVKIMAFAEAINKLKKTSPI